MFKDFHPEYLLLSDMISSWYTCVTYITMCTPNLLLSNVIVGIDIKNREDQKTRLQSVGCFDKKYNRI